MVIIHQRITIIRKSKPVEQNVNEELLWLGDALGLFSMRDKDKSCFRVFIELLKSAKLKQPLSSDEIALKLDLTRGTVIHHINRLMDSGIVVHEGKKYLLRVSTLSALVREVQKDLARTFDDLAEIAEEIDQRLGL